MGIVIDKSYLKGEKEGEIKGLSKKHQWFMTHSLLYELVKESPTERASLFKKFNENSPYVLLPTLGFLFRYETKNKKPCGRPSQLVTARDYSLHLKLCDESYKLTKQEEEVVQSEKDILDMHLEVFIRIIKNNMELKKSESQKDLIDKIIEDESYIISQYDNLNKKTVFANIEMLDGNLIDRQCFTFRWLQLMNLFTVDVAYRYESVDTIINSKKAQEKIRHDILDLEYLLFGVVEGAFATKEKKLIEWFKLLSKDGLVYT